jgi:hypothetical protein
MIVKIKIITMRSFAMKMLFVFFTIIIFACNKNNRDYATGIEGNWELRRITGGRPQTDYPAGNGNLLKFTNTTYQTFENGRLVKTGIYTIVEDASAQTSLCLVLSPEQYKNRIIYDNDYNATKKFFQISNDTLTIISGCFAIDAGSNTEYVRQ